MKKMTDRKMDMKKGMPKSDSFFPEDPEVRELPSAGSLMGFKYPDTDQQIHEDQEQFLRAANKEKLAEGYRH